MKRFTSLAGVVLILAAPVAAAAAGTTSQAAIAQSQDALFKTVSRLDTELFDTFNHCSSPEELQKHASYLSPSLEFYHDKGGVTWSRHDYIANTKMNACGKFRRYLIQDSVQVFPIKDYGAIEQGRHKFCYIKTGKCFGEAQFFIVWHHQKDGKWEATRIFSYGHRAIE